MITEAIDGEITWKDGVQIAVSTVIGGAEGALTALAPGGAPFISAAAGFAETAINGAIKGEDSAGEIIIDSVVSGFVNAAGTIGGVDCIKGGRLMNLAVKKVSKDVKKEARQTINKAFFSGVFSDLISNNILSWAT